MLSAKKELFTPSGGGSQISRSVRLRSSASAYLNRTPSSASDRRTWTYSGWIKRGLLTTRMALMGGYTGTTSGTLRTGIIILDGGALQVGTDQMQTATDFVLDTTQLFRDPAAWSHIVVALDTTQATSTNRVKIYVNGVQVTAFSTATYPSLNYQGGINFTNNQYINRWFDSSAGSYYGDGYTTEVNFIDGQALTPSSFGETNAITGVWQPKKYAGTYGTNGFYLPFTLNNNSTFAGGFNGSQYLTTSTNASLALGTNDFTVEYWLYISTAGGGNVVVSSGNGVALYDGLFGYQTGSGLILYLSSNNSAWDIANGVTIGSTPTGTWNHVAITRSGNTFRTFVNGVQGTTFTSSASIYQSANSFVLGRGQNNAGLIGNISNMRVVVGTALYTSNFVPSTSALAAVTNTKLLTLQDATIIDNSTNALTFTNTGSVVTATATPFANPTIGSDASGNANNWQPNNINVTTTGATYDSMIDVPTPYVDGGNGRGNYCVINPLDVSASTVSSGNLNITFATNSDTNRAATFGVSSGKWYWETTITAVGGTYSIVGITSGASTATSLGTASYQYSYISSTYQK
jgi:hypothetical protein